MGKSVKVIIAWLPFYENTKSGQNQKYVGIPGSTPCPEEHLTFSHGNTFLKPGLIYSNVNFIDIP